METKDTLSSCSNLEEQQMQQIQDKAKESCMVSFQRLHSHLKLLSNNDLKGTRTECGFKRAFATLFGQDVETFTGTMFLNMDQLEKQLDKEEFQEIGSIDAFKSIDKRALHKREYDIRVNERQMQTTKEKFDTSKALDASLVDTKSRQQHTEQPKFNNEGEVDQNVEQCHDTCPLPAKLTNQALKEGQHGQFLKVKSNEAKVKHDIYVIETINIELEHKVAKLLKENETLKKHYKDLYDSIKVTRTKTIEKITSLIAKNAEFKAQLQEKGFAIAALKNKLRKLTGNSVNTKFARTSILGKPVLQPHRNQSVVRQPTAFKSERPRISKPRFASQVDVNNDLSKPVTTHYLPKERESACAKPHHMIAPGSSRYSSNDMVHNHYLEEAKKQTQEIGRNSKTSVMPSARSQSTTNGSKPKPRINNQKSRNWPASKSSCVTTKTVPIAEHSRNSRNFSDSKHFVCSTCQKCVFNANHDHCVTKFLNEVNSHAKVPSNKTTNKNKPVEQISFAKKPERQILTGHRFSIKKTSVVHEKTMTPRFVLVWKQTVKFSKTVGHRWVPLERYSPLAQPRLTVNPQMVQMKISLTIMNANKLLMSVQSELEFKTIRMKSLVQSGSQVVPHNRQRQ
ncbi:gag-pol polyprotein [Tanacetum coccineum]